MVCIWSCTFKFTKEDFPNNEMDMYDIQIGSGKGVSGRVNIPCLMHDTASVNVMLK